MRNTLSIPYPCRMGSLLLSDIIVVYILQVARHNTMNYESNEQCSIAFNSLHFVIKIYRTLSPNDAKSVLPHSLHNINIRGNGQ